MDRAGVMAVVFCAVLAMMINCAVGQSVVHIVGDSLGWTVRLPNTTYYADWASRQNFTVGDSLVFNFTTGFHDVVPVPRASYNNCTAVNATSRPITTGPATITLNSAGAHYYICTIGTHCQSGQQLAITINAASTGRGAVPPSSATAPGASPPANGTTPRASPPSIATPPRASSPTIATAPATPPGATPPVTPPGSSPPTTATPSAAPSTPSAEPPTSSRPGSGAASLVGNSLFVLLFAGMVLVI